MTTVPGYLKPQYSALVVAMWRRSIAGGLPGCCARDFLVQLGVRLEGPEDLDVVLDGRQAPADPVRQQGMVLGEARGQDHVDPFGAAGRRSQVSVFNSVLQRQPGDAAARPGVILPVAGRASAAGAAGEIEIGRQETTHDIAPVYPSPGDESAPRCSRLSPIPHLLRLAATLQCTAALGASTPKTTAPPSPVATTTPTAAPRADEAQRSASRAEVPAGPLRTAGMKVEQKTTKVPNVLPQLKGAPLRRMV